MVSRRDGRAVDGAALEMLFRGDSNEGSNPSLSSFITKASLVQLVERRSPKPGVEGSSPSGRGKIKILICKKKRV